jgi:hypothetical protein
VGRLAPIQFVGKEKDLRRADKVNLRSSIEDLNRKCGRRDRENCGLNSEGLV